MRPSGGGTVAVRQPPNPERELQALRQAVGQVIYSERKDQDQDPQQMLFLLRRQQSLATVGRQLVTRELLVAHVGCVRRVLPELGQPTRRDRLLSGFYALRSLAGLLSQGLLPSVVPAGGPAVPKLSEADVLGVVARALEQLKQQRLLKAPPKDRTEQKLREVILGIFNSLWLVIESLLPTSTGEVLKLLFSSMADKDIAPLLCSPETLALYFLRVVCTTLHWLAKGNAANWQPLTRRLLKEFLLMQPGANPAISQTLGMVNVGDLGEQVWLGSLPHPALTGFLTALTDSLTLQCSVLQRFEALLKEPAPEPGMVASLLNRRPSPNDFRIAAFAALKDVHAEGEDAASALWVDVVAAFAASAGWFSGVQSAAVRTGAGRVLAAIQPSSIRDGAAAQLPPALRRHQLEYFHVCAIAATCAGGGGSLDTVSKDDRAALAQRATDTFLGLVLADDLMFADPTRKEFNTAFTASKHVENHPRALSYHGGAVMQLMQNLGAIYAEPFVAKLRAHAEAVNSCASKLSAAVRRSARGQQQFRKLAQFLMWSAAKVIEAVCSAVSKEKKERSRAVQKLDPALARSYLASLESYFPFFGHIEPPQIPRKEKGQNTAEHRARLVRAVRDWKTFDQLRRSLVALVAGLTAADRRFIDDIVANLVKAAEAAPTGPPRDPFQSSRVCFLLMVLHEFVGTAPLPVRLHNDLLPCLLQILRRRTEPESTVRCAHQVLFGLMHRPSPLALLALPLYLHTCVPVRTVGSEIRVDLGMLPGFTLIRLFTRCIRSLAQKFEEWDEVTLRQAVPTTPAGDDATVQELAKLGSKLADEESHPTGVGLVLYVTESLQATAMALNAFSPREQAAKTGEKARQRNLYIASLVNLLKCLNPRVVTAVCRALERVFAALRDVADVTFWLSYTSKAIKECDNVGTKQYVVQWFLQLQSSLSPQKMGIKAKL